MADKIELPASNIVWRRETIVKESRPGNGSWTEICGMSYRPYTKQIGLDTQVFDETTRIEGGQVVLFNNGKPKQVSIFTPQPLINQTLREIYDVTPSGQVAILPC